MPALRKVPPAHLPPDYSAAICSAFIALSEGRATDQQQKDALRFIVENVADYYGLSYRPGDTHETAFAEGRRFVGAQIVKLTRQETLKAASLLERKRNGPERRGDGA